MTKRKEPTMKATLTICGIDRGEIEIGENSFVALLARGEAGGAMSKLQELQDTLTELGCVCKIDTSLEGADDDRD